MGPRATHRVGPQVLSFILYLLTPFGLAGVAASAGRIAASLIEAVGPLLKGASEALVWFVKTLWEGLTDVADNISTVIFVVTVVLFTWFYVDYQQSKLCQQEIVETRKRLVPAAKPPKQPTSEFRWPWE